MHIFKRFYLLTSILIAFAVPLITFTQYVETSSEFAVNTPNQIAIISQQIQEPLPYLSTILWSIYAVGVLFFGIKFIYNLSKIVYNINNNPKYKHKNFTNVLLQDLTIPHTFFNYIFLNKLKFETQKIPNEVLLHEETHAQQKHSIDILIIEMLLVVFWFNPFIYFIKHAVKLNHEFLADQAVLNHGINTSNYQNILLKFSLNNRQPQLANAINYSFIKKRFTIMKTQTSKKGIWLRSLVLLPLLAVLIYGFSDRVTAQKESVMTKNVLIQVSEDKKILLNGEKFVTTENISEEIKKIVKDYNPDQLAKVKAIIEASENVKKGLITDISIEVVKAGITSRKLNLLKIEKEEQDKATPKQIAEYNALAKKYNGRASDNKIIKLKDVKRMTYIYNLMSEVQKKKAEPFPNIPPPPPPAPVTPKVSNVKTPVPPPPPLSKNASPYQKRRYNEAMKNYKSQKNLKVHTFETEDGELIEVIETPEVPEINEIPPPPPPFPKDATYYINGKKASLKQVKELKVGDIIKTEVIKENSKKGVVHITTKQ